MKRLISIAAIMIFLAGCTQGEDLVEGSIPAKKQEKVTADTNQIIIYFKDRIDDDPFYLNLARMHMDVIQPDGSSSILAGAEVFDSARFPQLLHGDVIKDTLVLFFREDFQLELDHRYQFGMEGHRLYCTKQGQLPPDCPERTISFQLKIEPVISDQYEPDYDPGDDPPYLEKSSPPDGIDFTAAPPFPPHGDLRIYLSEAMPNLTIATSSTSTAFPVSLIPVIPNDLIPLDADSTAGNKILPFDSTRHKHFLATTSTGWPINTEVSFTLISSPSNLDSVIAQCTDDKAIHCPKPALSNIVLGPTSDSTYAPIIMAESDTVVEISPQSGIYWGTYKKPSTANGTLGTMPDNIDVKARFARVRIDHPKAGLRLEYFNVTEMEGSSIVIRGIYTNNSSHPDENVTNVQIFVNDEDKGSADLLPDGTFKFYICEDDTKCPEDLWYLFDFFEIKAVATSPDGKAGFDIVEGYLLADIYSPHLTITYPANGSTIIQATPFIMTGNVIEDDFGGNNSGIAWLKVNGDYAIVDGSTWSYTFDNLPDGEISFCAEASDNVGNEPISKCVTIVFYNDSDADGLPAFWESQYGLTEPGLFAQDGPYDDSDGDGVLNLEEFQKGLNPVSDDTDSDGLKDKAEIDLDSNPNIPNTFYYVDSSAEGNDSYDGRCPEKDPFTNCGPWQTFTKITNTTFQAGDIVMFRKGGVWHEPSLDSSRMIYPIKLNGHGAVNNPIIYTSYGDDPELPVFDMRHYLDDLLKQSPLWSQTIINGNVVWQTSVMDQTPTTSDINATLFMQSLDTEYTYSSNFQRLAKVGFCSTSYTDINGTATALNTVAATPYTYCFDYNQAQNTVQYFINTPKDPNLYKIFVPWHGAIYSSSHDSVNDWIVIDGLKIRFTGIPGNRDWYSDCAISIYGSSHSTIRNCVIDTAGTSGIRLMGPTGNRIIGNQLLFVDQYGIRNHEHTSDGPLIANNIFLGHSSLDWYGQHGGEVSAIQGVFAHSGIVIRNNIIGYGNFSTIYIEKSHGLLWANTRDLIEGNIIFKIGSVFKPADNNGGKFVQLKPIYTPTESGVAIWDRNESNHTVKRNNIIYGSGTGIINGFTYSSDFMKDYNNTFFNVCFADANHGEYSVIFNNIGYNHGNALACGPSWVYATSRASGSLSDYNFWNNDNGPAIAWQDTALSETAWPTSTYSLAAFKVLDSNQINSAQEKCIHDPPSCNTLNEGHSKDTAGGPGLPRMYDSTICESSITDPADSYPRNTWPYSLTDIQNGCFPDFAPGSSVDSVVDAGAFIQDGNATSADLYSLVIALPWDWWADHFFSNSSNIYCLISSSYMPYCYMFLSYFPHALQIYDGAAPDMGAKEFDFPPPDPTGAEAQKLTSPDRIQLKWDNEVTKGGKDHYAFIFDLNYYLVTRKEDDVASGAIKVDRLGTCEIVDYGAHADKTYDYEIIAVDFQGNQSCEKVHVHCDAGSSESEVYSETNPGGGPAGRCPP